MAKGIPIKAPTNGKVTRIFNNDSKAARYYILPKTMEKYHQVVSTLRQIDNVKVGDRVKAGDIIAYSDRQQNDRRTFTFSKKNEGWRR
ncbi:M23 family metallopeptidase [Staphylococcus aureus]